jgi:hypothetical protein
MSGSSGSGPTETSNSSNSPGLIVPPVQVMVPATSVICSPKLSIGSSSVRGVTV